MKKKNKFMVYAIIGLIILSVLAVGYFFITYKPLGQSIVISSGCQFIKNPSNPSSAYTKIIESSSLGGLSYTCSGNKECVVSGSMNIEKPSQIAQTYYSCHKTGVSGSWATFEQCKVACCSATASTCSPCIKDVPSGSTEYSATFNFCPSSATFDYCSPATKNSITTSNAQVVTTEDYKLNGLASQSLSFTPKYADSSEILKKSIFVKEYDCSCMPLIQSTPQTYCSSDTTKVYCTSGCPSGSTLRTSVYCQKLNGVSSYKTLQNICADNSGYCFTPQYTGYKTCTGTQDVQGSTCSIWAGTNICSTGQQCILDSTGKAGEGIGGCKCPSDACTIGTFIKTGDSAYQRCEKSASGCNTLVDDQCNEGLTFDATTNKCVCSASTSCNSQDTQCIGSSQIRTCSPKSIADKQCPGGVCQCYSWDLTASSCGSNRLCKIASGADYCTCEGVSTCSLGQIKCKDSINYLECSQSPNDPLSCLDYRDLGQKVDSGTQICNINTNKIELKASTCTQTSDGSLIYSPCITSTDTNGVSVESCISGTCRAISDENTATSLDVSKTRCSSNIVQKVITYNGKSGAIYRWETKTDAPYSTNGVCNSDFTCANGICESNNKFMIVTSKDSYAVGESISNITIQMTSLVENKGSGLPITLQLFDSEGNEIVSARNTGSKIGALGKSTINLGYSHTLVEDLTLKIKVGDYSGSKKIVIANNLIVKPTCPSVAIVDRDIICNWKVVDAKSNTLVTNNLDTSVKVTQGTTEILDYELTTSSIKFSSSKAGSVKLIVSATASGYLPGSATISIPINSPTISQALLIDNKDSSEYSGGVNTGIHQLILDVEESGQPLDVAMIEATMLIPSGAEQKLTFSKSSMGKWTTSYNLLQAGQTYIITGNIVPSDISKSVTPFEYSISTVGTSTQDLSTQTNTIIIAIVIGIISIIAIIALIWYVARKTK